jgi:hypothetical protein
VNRDDLTVTEQLVWDAYSTGLRVNLADRPDRTVRGGFLRFLLLGGSPSPPGHSPALRLDGARVTDRLTIAYADIAAPISLRDCVFDQPVDAYGATLRQLSLRDSALPGLIAANATVGGSLRLLRCAIAGVVNLVGAHIGGLIMLDGSRIEAAPRTLDATRAQVGSDVRGADGFVSTGELCLNGAQIGGSVLLEGATLQNPDGNALVAAGARVAGVANLCGGLTSAGSIVLSNATVDGIVCFKNATLTGDGKRLLDLRHLQTGELVLRPAQPLTGPVDLAYAAIGLLRDDPARWPPTVRLDGATYDALSDDGDIAARLNWLNRAPRGHPPQVYAQLAATLAAAGRDDDARTVRLAGERHRHRRLAPTGRAWGWVQDKTVGYGYLPARAVGWLVLLLVAGSVIFALDPPRVAEAGKAPAFHPVAYAADLLLPVVDLGQEKAYLAQGWTAWFAYFLSGAGLLFATTAAAAIARRLRRT